MTECLSLKCFEAENLHLELRLCPKKNYVLYKKSGPSIKAESHSKWDNVTAQISGKEMTSHPTWSKYRASKVRDTSISCHPPFQILTSHNEVDKILSW